MLKSNDFIGTISVIDNGKQVRWYAEKSLEEYGVFGLNEPLALHFAYYVEASRRRTKVVQGLGLIVLSDNAYTPADGGPFPSLCDQDRHESRMPHNLPELCRNRLVACCSLYG